MLTIVHVLVGMVIGKYVNNIFVIILLALISHYVLDFIPHTSMNAVPGYKKGGLKFASKKGLVLRSIEPVLGLVLAIVILYLNKERVGLMFVGLFFAFFPDLIQFIGWKNDFHKLKKIVPYPGSIIYNKAKSLIVGIGTQIIVGVAALMLLLKDVRIK